MTLADGLVALAVFAILIAFALPQFKSPDTKEVSLQRSLQKLRDQIDLYRFRHDSRLPGDEGTETDLLNDLQRTMPVEASSRSAFPANPINGKSTVLVSESHPRDGSTGWWYRPSTGEIRANVEEPQPDGRTDTVLSSL
ncbi:MAG: type II secretion system protein [Planctomycetaceae bacterium]